MNYWNFEWGHVLVVYCAVFIVNGVVAVLEKEIGAIGAYLAILATMCLVHNLLRTKEKCGGRGLKERLP